MEYYSLANSVGVQLESSRDAQSEAMSSHPSSGFVSARRRHHEQLLKTHQDEIKDGQEERKKFEEEKRRADEEADKLRASIEAQKKNQSLGKVIEVRSSAEASINAQSDRAAATNVPAELRASKEKMRASLENPILEEKPEPAAALARGIKSE